MKKMNTIVLIAYVVLLAAGVMTGMSIVLIILKGWWDMLTFIAIAAVVAAYAFENIIEES